MEIILLTGRTHQIRCQLAAENIHIKRDLKYGAKRNDTLNGIRLHSAKIEFTNPFDEKEISALAPLPQNDILWNTFLENINNKKHPEN